MASAQPPDSVKIFDHIANSGVPLEELQEMVKNDEYLRDFIDNMEPMRKFRSECDAILDKTLLCASENTNLLNEISAAMEEHNGLMAAYAVKRTKLEELIRKVKDFKEKCSA